MANAVYFDTLAYANKLIEVDVPAKQAEIQAETFVEIFGELAVIRQDINDVRQDINDVRQELNSFRQEVKLDFKSVYQEFDKLRSEMSVKFSEQKAETIKWVVGISTAQAAVIISMLKVFSLILGHS